MSSSRGRKDVFKCLTSAGLLKLIQGGGKRGIWPEGGANATTRMRTAVKNQRKRGQKSGKGVHSSGSSGLDVPDQP